MDNLPELRDIHLPDDTISIFPLAWGWWGLFFCALVVIALYYCASWIRQTSAKIYARHLIGKLKDHNTLASAVKMSEILRRICVRQYPEAVAITNDDWIKFLNSKTKTPLKKRTAELLQNAPFIPDNSFSYSSDDVADLWLFCNHWIGENL